jgi:hypothetical protein
MDRLFNCPDDRRQPGPVLDGQVDGDGPDRRCRRVRHLLLHLKKRVVQTRVVHARSGLLQATEHIFTVTPELTDAADRRLGFEFPGWIDVLTPHKGRHLLPDFIAVVEKP